MSHTVANNGIPLWVRFGPALKEGKYIVYFIVYFKNHTVFSSILNS